MPNPTHSKNVNWIIVALFVITAGIAFYHSSHAASSAKLPPAINGTLLPSPKTISAFHFLDDNNNTFDNQNLNGHWTFMFFGFTRCQDVCPETLAQLNLMFKQLQNKLDPQLLPQIVFVTVDPDRDTTPVLHNYMQSFNPHFIGLHGDEATLNQFKNELGVYFAKKPKENGDYGMEHSSQIFILNPNGDWIGILNYPFQAQRLVSDYKMLIHDKD